MTLFQATGNAETAYERRGSGAPLLLMHGLQGGRRMLERLVDQLQPSFGVINYDQRDSGETRNPPEPYDVARLADDAAELVRGLGYERVHVFGTSFGGRIAQAFAIRHPGLVDRLVLGSTWAMPQSMLDVNPAGVARLMDIRSRLPASGGELAEMFVPGPFLRDHPEVLALLSGSADAPQRGERRAQAAVTVVGQASSITAPTLLIAGELDQMVPATATAALAKEIVGARFVQLAGVGHTAALQVPGQLAGEIAAFLQA